MDTAAKLGGESSQWGHDSAKILTRKYTELLVEISIHPKLQTRLCRSISARHALHLSPTRRPKPASTVSKRRHFTVGTCGAERKLKMEAKHGNSMLLICAVWKFHQLWACCFYTWTTKTKKEHDLVALSLSLKHWIISLDFSWKDDFLRCSSLQESLIIWRITSLFMVRNLILT